MDEIIKHECEWYWGYSITLVCDGGMGMVTMQFEKETQMLVYLTDLIVHQSIRKKGVANRLLEKCFEIAIKKNMSFMQLRADKKKDWLVKWYERKGFRKMREEENEYVLLKVL